MKSSLVAVASTALLPMLASAAPVAAVTNSTGLLKSVGIPTDGTHPSAKNHTTILNTLKIAVEGINLVLEAVIWKNHTAPTVKALAAAANMIDSPLSHHNVTVNNNTAPYKNDTAPPAKAITAITNLINATLPHLNATKDPTTAYHNTTTAPPVNANTINPRHIVWHRAQDDEDTLPIGHFGGSLRHAPFTIIESHDPIEVANCDQLMCDEYHTGNYHTAKFDSEHDPRMFNSPPGTARDGTTCTKNKAPGIYDVFHLRHFPDWETPAPLYERRHSKQVVKALRDAFKGCGLMSGWHQHQEWDGNYISFNLPKTAKHGCVERSIKRIGGPDLNCDDDMRFGAHEGIYRNEDHY